MTIGSTAAVLGSSLDVPNLLGRRPWTVGDGWLTRGGLGMASRLLAPVLVQFDCFCLIKFD